MSACDWEVLGCEECEAYIGLDPALQAEVEAWAVNRLWSWTGRRYGPCPTTMHTDDPYCCSVLDSLRLQYPQCDINEIILPGPIQEVTEVVMDGVTMNLADFHVDNYNILVYDVGTAWLAPWSVSYSKGEPVPPGGTLVAGILACEYAKALCNDNACRLPKRISSVVRQGITMTMLDNFTNLENGFTGIFEIDDWIMSQTKPKRRAYITSPDVPVYRETTWTSA